VTLVNLTVLTILILIDIIFLRFFSKKTIYVFHRLTWYKR